MPDTPSPALAAAPLRDRLALLLESTGDGIYGIDTAGHCTFANRAATELLGWCADELLGRNMHDLVHHSHEDGRPYAEADCPILRAFRQGLPCRVDTEVFWRRDGTPFPVEYTSHPVLDDGQVVGAVIAFIDITERRRARELLQRERDSLELRVAERTAELSRALADLRALAAHAEAVRETERNRIAREIHDELGAQLVALKFDIAWLRRRVAGEPGGLADKCDAMARTVERAVENVGRIIDDLRPSILDHQGLFAALEWQVQLFREGTELDAELRIHRAAGCAEPGGAAATALFRIVQELLSNIARHARASRVQMALGVDDDGVHLTVEDDGAGAPADAFESSRRYGVRGMRERVRHLGGEMRIRSSPGMGTRVALHLPPADAGDAPAA